MRGLGQDDRRDDEVDEPARRSPGAEAVESKTIQVEVREKDEQRGFPADGGPGERLAAPLPFLGRHATRHQQKANATVEHEIQRSGRRLLTHTEKRRRHMSIKGDNPSCSAASLIAIIPDTPAMRPQCELTPLLTDRTALWPSRPHVRPERNRPDRRRTKGPVETTRRGVPLE